MPKSARWMPLALALIALPCAVPAAQPDLSLAKVARASGLTYSWLGVQRSVSLTRQGLVIVVRPGAHEFEVNDRVESTADAPRYAGGDLLVSPAMARRIEALARASAPRIAASQPVVTEPVPRGTPLTGSISLQAHPLAGREAVVVEGQAPPAAPVTITLLATISSDIPTVLLTRRELRADSDGRFRAIMPIAADYVRGSILTVRATSVPNVASAETQLLVGAPNEGVSVPAEQLPPDAR